LIRAELIAQIVQIDGGGLSDRSDPSDRTDRTDETSSTPYDLYRALVEDADAETAANTAICLIHQANYLLDRQLQQLERQFIQEGGYTEQLAGARRQYRSGKWSDRSTLSDRSDRSDRSDLTTPPPPPPACPKCGKPMVLRTARKGPRAGSQFWGCPAYPDCSGIRPL